MHLEVFLFARFSGKTCESIEELENLGEDKGIMKQINEVKFIRDILIVKGRKEFTQDLAQIYIHSLINHC